MRIAMRTALPPQARRWRWNAAFALALSAFAGLLVKSAFPEALSPVPAPHPAVASSTDQSNDASAKAEAEAETEAEQEPGDQAAAKNEPPQHKPDARAYYRALIEKEAARAGLSPEVAEAVMAVESSYNPATIGGVGEIGLMQLLPSTARMLGFTGTLAELAVPETNIHYGVTYLAQAWRLARGDLCTATMKYRAGHGETRFSYRSVNYCLAVRAKLFARGYPVTGSVPTPTFGLASISSSASSSCRRNCLTGSAQGRVNLDAINSSLNQIVLQTNARAVRVR